MENQSSIVEEIERRRPVDVVAIERELADLWKAAAKSGEGGGEAVMRVCLLNLLIYTSDEDESGRLSDIIAVVTEHAPCRAMVLLGNTEDTETRINAWISSHCHLSHNRQQVCCEEIRVSASGEALNHLADTTAPLLVADLPTFLLWLDAKAMDTTVFTSFLGHVNRVIVDSGQLTHRDHEFTHQAQLIFDARRRAAFSDLNWARLNFWRELIAGLFDSTEMLQHLKRLNRVVIRYAHDGESEGVPIRTLLLTGWLATKLNWKLKDAAEITPNRLEFRFRTPTTRLQLDIEPVSGTEYPPLVMTGITLSTGGEKAALFDINRHEKHDAKENFEIKVEVTDGAAHSRVVSYHRPNDAEMIAHEVEIFGRDRTYENAARATMDLISEIEADRLLQ